MHNHTLTSIENGYILTLNTPVVDDGGEPSEIYDHILTLNEDRYDVTLTTPIVSDGETGDYNKLINKPRINDVTLEGNMSLERLGIQPAGNYPNSPLTDEDLEELIRDEI